MIQQQQVIVVDDDADVRDSIRTFLEASGFSVQTYASAKLFLADDHARTGCVIADVRMPDMGGLELQEEIVRREMALPVIVITGHGDVALAVQAMRAGAINFLEKPFDNALLLDSIRHALEVGLKARNRTAEEKAAKLLLALLTPREHAVLEKLVQGRANKVAAFELGISPRTVEIHRARIMEKLKAASFSDLVRTVLAAGQGDAARH